MGRRDRRKRLRKRRRQEVKAADAHALEHGLPLPSLFPNGPPKERRDPSLRWRSLSARGGLKFGFKGTGHRVPVDFDDPGAEHALTVALANALHPEPEEC